MSFILDALKKSENERQRQTGPSLADIPLRRARSERPWWAVAVAGLLVINLGVLIVVLMRNRGSESPAAPPAHISQQAPLAQSPPAVALERSAAAMPTPAQTNPAVRSLADEAGEDELADEALLDPEFAGAAGVPDGPPVVRSVTPPSVAPLTNQPAFAARERARAAEEEILPTHTSLVASGTNLPDMRLDIHVYSTSSAERFVFVNMRKYVEGQNLSEGPLLERITTEGAVLNHNGTRFLLPRQ